MRRVMTERQKDKWQIINLKSFIIQFSSVVRGCFWLELPHWLLERLCLSLSGSGSTMMGNYKQASNKSFGLIDFPEDDFRDFVFGCFARQTERFLPSFIFVLLEGLMTNIRGRSVFAKVYLCFF